MQRKKGSKRIEMIIKMVNEFKLTVVYFAQTRCRSVHARGFTAGQRTVENQDWATGPLGCRASGLRAAGPSGR